MLLICYEFLLDSLHQEERRINRVDDEEDRAVLLIFNYSVTQPLRLRKSISVKDFNLWKQTEK